MLGRDICALRTCHHFEIPSPVNEEQKRDDGFPICFDWLVLKTIRDNLHVRPAAAQRAPRPLVVGVQHHKTEAQVPEEYRGLWDQLKDIEGLMLIENPVIGI